jgi:acyl-CoA synthetase (AMP-forming)/AMP-acid ligase II
MVWVRPHISLESAANPRLGSLIDHQLEHNGTHVWADLAPRGGHAALAVTYRELGEAVHGFGRKLLASIGEPKLADGLHTVVGILSPSDGIVYATVLLAILRAGFVVRVLSCLDEGQLRLIAVIAHLPLSPELARWHCRSSYCDRLPSRSRTV